MFELLFDFLRIKKTLIDNPYYVLFDGPSTIMFDLKYALFDPYNILFELINIIFELINIIFKLINIIFELINIILELINILSPKFKRVSLNDTPEFPFWGLNIYVNFDLRGYKKKEKNISV